MVGTHAGGLVVWASENPLIAFALSGWVSTGQVVVTGQIYNISDNCNG